MCSAFWSANKPESYFCSNEYLCSNFAHIKPFIKLDCENAMCTKPIQNQSIETCAVWDFFSIFADTTKIKFFSKILDTTNKVFLLRFPHS